MDVRNVKESRVKNQRKGKINKTKIVLKMNTVQGYQTNSQKHDSFMIALTLMKVAPSKNINQKINIKTEIL